MTWTTSTRKQHTGSPAKQAADARHVMARDAGICHVCGQPGANQVDHIIPVAEGGADTPANKAPIHARPCHVLKTAAEAARGRQRRRATNNNRLNRLPERHPGVTG